MSHITKNTEHKLIRIYSDANIRLFGDLLDSQDWNTIFTQGSIDDWFNKFVNVVKTHHDTACPLKTKKKNSAASEKT